MISSHAKKDSEIGARLGICFSFTGLVVSYFFVIFCLTYEYAVQGWVALSVRFLLGFVRLELCKRSELIFRFACGRSVAFERLCLVETYCVLGYLHFGRCAVFWD